MDGQASSKHYGGYESPGSRDPRQRPAAVIPFAQAALKNATNVALTNMSLCKVARVLRTFYKRAPAEIDQAQIDLAAVQAGLAFLNDGGDFADGVIAYSGARLGGATFITSDRRARDIAAGLGLVAEAP